MNRLLTFFLAALLTFSVSWAATVTKTMDEIINENNYVISSGSTATCYTSFSLDNNITVSTSGSPNCGAFFGSAVPHDWRLYQAKNGDVTITAGNNCTLESITFTYSTSNGGKLTGAASGTAITVSGTSATYIVSNTGSATNGQVRITAISVTYSGGANFVDPPTITPSGGNFVTTQEVTLSHADGGTIYYTLDGSDPTESSTLYSAPFTLYETTTVKAIAVKGGISSSPATATFTKTGVATIAEALAVAQNSTFTFTGSAVVTYQTGRYVWIRDNTGSGLIFRGSSDTGTLNNGDILNANWTAKNTTFNSVPEFSNPTDVASSSNDGPIAPFDKTLTGVTSANINEYVSFSNVTPSWDSSLGYSYITIGNNKVYFRNNFFGYISTGLAATSGHTYNIEGIVYVDNGNVFVYMTSVTEVNTGTPLLEALPTSLTFNDSGTGNSITVTGSNLGSDNVGLTLATENSKFTPTLSTTTGWSTDGGTYWYFTPNNGSLNGMVAMNYTGRELSASETVTLANNVASTTVTVNYRADLYIVGDYGSGWDFSTGTPMTYDDTNNTYTATITVDADNLILFARKYDSNALWGTRYVFGPNSNGDWTVDTTPNPKTGNIDLNDDDPIYFVNAGTYTIEINATTGALTVTREVENTGDFELVTNVNDLNAGEEVIFVNTGTAGSAYAMSTTQGTNNRPGTAVTVSNGLKVSATNETQIFTLEAGTGGWYFKTVNGDIQGYIYASSSSSNQLKTQATANDNAKATISLAGDGAATIVFQGSNSRNHMRYNPNNGSPIFNCYSSTSTTGNLAYIYKRSASIEPSIEVDPASLEIVIPAGSSSEQGTVTVTETNTSGTTSVNITGDGASNFTASLNNGTLTVTYSGTATQANPDEATITLTNGSASATVDVTGFKMPMTVTITPADGHTFSTNTVTGIIESNVADATIEYSFDGTVWYTYDADNGFTTPEVTTEGGTVTVYARATYNGETAMAQVTYTHEAPSKKCTADIVFDPTSNNGEVTQWSTLQQHMSDGVDYISDATMAAVFTSNDYDAMRFGSGKNVGTMTFTLNLKNFDGGACKLTKVTINAARYSSDTECSLNVSTNVSSGQTVSITADQDNFADYVFNFDGSEVTTLTITNLVAGKRVYVHSITLEYNCPEAAELSVIEREYETSTQEKVAITDRLIGVWAAKDILWAKDQGNASIDATSIREGEQVDYVRKAKLKSADAPFQIGEWDQSNWVMLDFSGIDAEPADYVGFELENNSIVGHYVDDMNYRIELLQAPTTVGNQMDDYPGFDGDPIDEANRYNLNHYVSSNFYEPNLNWGDYTGYWYEGEYNGHSIDTCIFFMNPKICEIAQVWAVWNATMHQFTIYENVDFSINGYDLDGAFTMNQETWKYNCRSTASGLSEDQLYGSVEDDLQDDAYYIFHVVVMRDNYNYGHRKNGQSLSKRNAEAVVPEAKDSDAISGSIRVYPLDLTSEGAQNPPTGIREILDVTSSKTVESVRYFNVMGMESKEPFEGINIVVTRYTDGSFSTAKVLK